jgi:hypothetical protein
MEGASRTVGSPPGFSLFSGDLLLLSQAIEILGRNGQIARACVLKNHLVFQQEQDVVHRHKHSYSRSLDDERGPPVAYAQTRDPPLATPRSITTRIARSDRDFHASESETYIPTQPCEGSSTPLPIDVGQRFLRCTSASKQNKTFGSRRSVVLFSIVVCDWAAGDLTLDCGWSRWFLKWVLWFLCCWRYPVVFGKPKWLQKRVSKKGKIMMTLTVDDAPSRKHSDVTIRFGKTHHVDESDQGKWIILVNHGKSW